jgi:hypothetical protein
MNDDQVLILIEEPDGYLPLICSLPLAKARFREADINDLAEYYNLRATVVHPGSVQRHERLDDVFQAIRALREEEGHE